MASPDKLSGTSEIVERDTAALVPILQRHLADLRASGVEIKTTEQAKGYMRALSTQLFNDSALMRQVLEPASESLKAPTDLPILDAMLRFVALRRQNQMSLDNGGVVRFNEAVLVKNARVGEGIQYVAVPYDGTDQSGYLVFPMVGAASVLFKHLTQRLQNVNAGKSPDRVLLSLYPDAKDVQFVSDLKVWQPAFISAEAFAPCIDPESGFVELDKVMQILNSQTMCPGTVLTDAGRALLEARGRAAAVLKSAPAVPPAPEEPAQAEAPVPEPVGSAPEESALAPAAPSPRGKTPFRKLVEKHGFFGALRPWFLEQ